MQTPQNARATLSKWYAVNTKPCWEKKTAQILGLKQVEHYCPLQKELRQWSDRKKIIYVPVFTSYVFVRITEGEQVRVLETDGILRFVRFEGRPAVIRDTEILAIRLFLRDYEMVQVHKADLDVNDTVRIVSGPLMMQEGTVVGVKSKSVRVLLPSLGLALTAEIEKQHLEKMASH